MYDAQKVREFQDALISKGWLDMDSLNAAGEYGIMGDVTYAVIADVQDYYAANGGWPELSPVKDNEGNFRPGGMGDYYPIDENTYTYIMQRLPNKNW